MTSASNENSTPSPPNANDYQLNNIAVAGGRNMLHELVKENREEYHTLSEDEKGRLVEEFNEFKVSKAIGICTTAKSKINDVTHTLKAVETEVSFLSSHCLRYLSQLFF